MDKKAFFKLGLLILLVVTIVILFRATGLNSRMNLGLLKNYIASFGIWAPLVFILIYTIRPLTLFPGTILTIAAAFLFGIFWGTVYATLGATSGAVVAFILARKLGRDALTRFIGGGRFTQFDDNVAQRGLILILILRLVPVIIPSFDAVNFGAGLSKIRFWDFTLGTLLGLIPGTLFLVAISLSAVTPSSPRFWGPLVAWCIFIVCALIYLNYKRKQGWLLLSVPSKNQD